MVVFGPVWLYIAVFLFASQHATAQSCYYPDGSLAPSTEKPCSTGAGSACCPDSWICLDNGLCHYPADDLYERYSCTDKTWNSQGCPSNLCTYDGQASGAESITQCSNHSDKWCCNADAQNVRCCQELPLARPFFTLKEGRPYATIGIDQATHVPILSAITGIAIGNSNPSDTSQLQSSIQVATASMTISIKVGATPTSGKWKSTSLYSGSTGVETDVVTTPIFSPETTPEPPSPLLSSQTSDSKKTRVVVGCVIGITLGLVVIGVLVYQWHKHLRPKAHPYMRTNNTNVTTKHWSLRFLPELEGHPFHSRRSVATSKRPVELDAGITEFRPAALLSHRPGNFGADCGVLNNQSYWDGIPPRYPPSTDRNTHNHQSLGTAELDGTPVTRSPKRTFPS